MDEERLKPCPFCGGTDLFTISGVRGTPEFYSVSCSGCHGSWWQDSGNFDGWNNRSTETALQKELDDLKRQHPGAVEVVTDLPNWPPLPDAEGPLVTQLQDSGTGPSEDGFWTHETVVREWPDQRISGAERTNITKSDWLGDWFVGYGKDESCVFEGTWWDMICFARNVLASENTQICAPQFYMPGLKSNNYAGEQPYEYKEEEKE